MKDLENEFVPYKEVLELLRKAHFAEENIEDWFEQNKKK